jgi:hypothetical protein
MIKNIRKFVLAAGAIAFLLASADIFLFVHLAEHKADKHHDHNNCPICQQAIANKTKAILPAVSVTFEQPQITITDVYVTKHIVKAFKFLTPYLRAPPLTA